jgi:hypothetical protein
MMTLHDFHHELVNLELNSRNEAKKHDDIAKAKKHELTQLEKSPTWPQGAPDAERHKVQREHDDAVSARDEHTEVAEVAHEGYFKPPPSHKLWTPKQTELYSAARDHGRLKHSTAEEKAGMY